MIPDFLKDREEELKAYVKPSIHVFISELTQPALEDPLGILQSKYLGLPFIPLEMDYPKDSKGRPMILGVQINFEDLPQLDPLPKDGVFQIFLSQNFTYPGDEYKTFYHPADTLTHENMSDFSILDASVYDGFPIKKIHELSFQLTTDYGGAKDSDFNMLFDDMTADEFLSELLDTDNEKYDELADYLACDGNKIGGYAEFIQSDVRKRDAKGNLEFQLLQMDGEYIKFDDWTYVHLFIPFLDLKDKNFENTYIYWDCD